MNGGLEFCIYITPCGYCSKFDKWCEKKCDNNKRNTNFNFSSVKENDNGNFEFKDLK